MESLKRVFNWSVLLHLDNELECTFTRADEVLTQHNYGAFKVCTLNGFFKWANPGLFFIIFGLFKQTLQIFATKYM